MGTRNWVFSWIGCGSMVTYWGLPDNDNVTFGTFSSYHTGVVNFCFADGSVRSLRRNSDYDTFAKYISGWFDGQVPDLDLVQ